MKLNLYKLKKKTKKYYILKLNEQCRRSAENRKVLSPGTLNILLSPEFSPVQRANLRL